MDHVTLAGALDGIVGGIVGGLAALGGTLLALRHERNEAILVRRHERRLALSERLDNLADISLHAAGVLRRAATYGTKSDETFREAFDNWSEAHLIYNLRLRRSFAGAARLHAELRLKVIAASQRFAVDDPAARTDLSATLRAYTEGVARWIENHRVFEGSHSFDVDAMIAAQGPEPLIVNLEVE